MNYVLTSSGVCMKTIYGGRDCSYSELCASGTCKDGRCANDKCKPSECTSCTLSGTCAECITGWGLDAGACVIAAAESAYDSAQGAVSWSSADGLSNGMACYKSGECTSGYCSCVRESGPGEGQTIMVDGWCNKVGGGICANPLTISTKAWIIIGVVLGLLALFVLGFALRAWFRTGGRTPTTLHNAAAFENPVYHAGGTNGDAAEVGAGLQAPTNDVEV